MREVCVKVTVKPDTLAQQRAWEKLWQILLQKTEPAEELQREPKNPAPAGTDAGQEQ
jgi:hypothetical protein